MTSTPLTSIILPAYNAEKYIGEAIDSVFDQTHENWQLIIVDDGSTDQTISIAKEYAKKDNRITLLENHHSGLPAVARNHGLKQAKGELITFLDADDLWKTNKLEVQIAQLPENGWSFSNSEFFGDAPTLPNGLKYQKNWHPQTPFFDQLLTTEGISLPSILITRSLLRKISPDEDISHAFDTSLGVEDWDLTLRLAQETEPIYIPQPLVRIRQHSSGFSRTYEKQYERTIALIEKYEKLGTSPALVNQAKRLQLSKRATGRMMNNGGSWRKDLLTSCATPPRSIRDLYLSGLALLPQALAKSLYTKGIKQIRKGWGNPS